MVSYRNGSPVPSELFTAVAGYAVPEQGVFKVNLQDVGEIQC